MKLPVLKTVEHLSPSSVKEFDRCQYLFYLKRMANLPWPKGTQSLAAAVGSAFDCFIKRGVAEHIGLADMPEYNLDTMLNKSVESHCREIAIPKARDIFNQYVKAGCFRRLLKEDIQYISDQKKELITVGEDEVPILGIPDLFNKNGMPYELKVSGSMSASGASPTPGYKVGYRGLTVLPPHDRCNEPFDAINREWSEQLVTYSWLHCGVKFEPLPIAVEEVSCRGDKYTFTSIRSFVTVECQKALWAKFVACWDATQTGEITPAAPNDKRCLAFGSLCDMAPHCDPYQASLKAKTSENSSLFK